MKKALKRTMSIVMILSMLITTFCFFDIGSVLSNAQVTKNEHVLAEAGSGSYFSKYAINVPEIIYIQAGGKTSNYFANSNADGTVSNPTSSSGTLSFSCATATKVVIKAQLYTTSLGTTSAEYISNIKLADGTNVSNSSTGLWTVKTENAGNYSTTITSVTVANGTPDTAYILKWTFVYTINGKDYTTYAYTGIKCPSLKQAGFAQYGYYDGFYTDTTGHASYGFITGVDSVSGGNRASAFNNTTTKTSGRTAADLIAPLVYFVGQRNNGSDYSMPSGNGNTVIGNTTYFPNTSNGGVVYHYDSSSRSKVWYAPGDSSNKYNTNNMCGLSGSTDYGEAKITIDRSRFSDFNQVPNLSAGWVQFSNHTVDSYFYINRLQAIRNTSYTTGDAAEYFREDRTANLESGDYNKWNTSNTQDYPIYCAVPRDDVESSDCNSWVQGLYPMNGAIPTGSSTKTTYMRFESSNVYNPIVGYDEYYAAITTVKFTYTTADKTNMRKEYYEYLNSGVCTNASNWSTINSAVEAMAKSLCVTTSTTTTYTDITSAISTAQTYLRDNVMNAVTSEPLYFYVPETIYLEPNVKSWTISTTSSFQYYIQNTVTDSTANLKSTPATNTNRDKTGYIYFQYSNASNISISTRSVTEVGSDYSGYDLNKTVSIGSLSKPSGKNYYQATISSNTSPSLGAGTTGYYIEWKATFTDSTDGYQKQAYAYTYVYKPYVVPTAAGTTLRCTDGNDHDNSQLTWMAGFHNIYADATTPTTGDSDKKAAYPRYSLVSQGTTSYWSFSPFMSYDTGSVSGDINYSISNMNNSGNQAVANTRNNITRPDYRKQSTAMKLAFASSTDSSSYMKYKGLDSYWAHDWMSESNVPPSNGDPTKTTTYNKKTCSFYYYYSGEDQTSCIDTGGVGGIYIDTSRYTNLNQIPNLGVGMMMTDNKDTSTSDDGAWMIGDYTGWASSTYAGHQNNGNKMRDEWTNVNYYIAGMGHPDNKVDGYDSQNLKYAGNWNRSILSGDNYTYQIKSAQMNNQGSDWITVQVVLKLHCYQMDKTNLRNAVTNATKNMATLNLYSTKLESSYFNGTEYDSFVSYYKTAVKVLTKLDGYSTSYDTTSELNTLANNLNSAVNALVKDGKSLKTGNAKQFSVGLVKQADGTYKAVALPGGEVGSTQNTHFKSYTARDNLYFTKDNYEGYTFKGAMIFINTSSVWSGCDTEIANMFSTYSTVNGSIADFLSPSSCHYTTISQSGTTTTFTKKDLSDVSKKHYPVSIKTPTITNDGSITFTWCGNHDASNMGDFCLIYFYICDQHEIYFDVNDGATKVNILPAAMVSFGNDGGFDFDPLSRTANGVTLSYDYGTGLFSMYGTTTANGNVCGWNIYMNRDDFRSGVTYSYTMSFVNKNFSRGGNDAQFVIDYKNTRTDYTVMDRTGCATGGFSWGSFDNATTFAKSGTFTITNYDSVVCLHLSNYTNGAGFNYGTADNPTTFRLEVTESSSGNLQNHSPMPKIRSYGDNYGTLPIPTRENYEFLGWYTEPDSGERVSSGTIMGNKNVTVYAHWTPVEYHVLLDNEFDVDRYMTTAVTARGLSNFTSLHTNWRKSSNAVYTSGAATGTNPATYTMLKAGDGKDYIGFSYKYTSTTPDEDRFDHYATNAFTIPAAGDYTVELKYRVNDFYSTCLEKDENTDGLSAVFGLVKDGDSFYTKNSYFEKKEVTAGWDTESFEYKGAAAGDSVRFQFAAYFWNPYTTSSTAQTGLMSVDICYVTVKNSSTGRIVWSTDQALNNGSGTTFIDYKFGSLTVSNNGSESYDCPTDISTYKMNLTAGTTYTFSVDYIPVSTTGCVQFYIFGHASETEDWAKFWNMYYSWNEADYLVKGGTLTIEFTPTTDYHYISLGIGTSDQNDCCILSNFVCQPTYIYEQGTTGYNTDTKLGGLINEANAVKVLQSSNTTSYVNDFYTNYARNGATMNSSASYNEKIEDHYQYVACSLPYDGLYIPEREGATFDGWYTAPTGGTKIVNADGTNALATGDGVASINGRKLYSHWTFNKFMLDYNANNVTAQNMPGNNNELKYGVAAQSYNANVISSNIPTAANKVFIGWNTKADGKGDNYYPGDDIAASKINNYYKSTTAESRRISVYAQWLDTKTADETAKNAKEEYLVDNPIIPVVMGIELGTDNQWHDINESESSLNKKYTEESYDTYKGAADDYITAKNAVLSAVNDDTVDAVKSKIDNLAEKITDLDSNYNDIIDSYFNNFTIRYANGTEEIKGIPAGTYSLDDMNLNHYTTETLSKAQNDLSNGETFLDETHYITDQATLNTHVKNIATDFISKEQVKARPVYKMYETPEAVKDILDKSEDVDAVNFVATGSSDYTYYCYTHCKKPTVILDVNEVKGTDNRVCYPTTISEKADATNTAAPKTVNVVSDVTTDAEFKLYKDFIDNGIGSDLSRYNQKSRVELKPDFSNAAAKTSVSYTFSAKDDSYNETVATKASLSGDKFNSNAETTIDGGTEITIVFYYKDANGFAVTHDQCNIDYWLHQYHLFRTSGGASNWEIFGWDAANTSDITANPHVKPINMYPVYDEIYGQAEHVGETFGSFIYTFRADKFSGFTAGTTDEEVNTASNLKLVRDYVADNFNAVKADTYTKYVKGDNSTGLGYVAWPGTASWSMNYYPQSRAYTYVHLIDKWGNYVDQIVPVPDMDYIPTKSIPSQSAGSVLLEESGGSGIATASLNANSIQIITDDDSTLADNVYRTTGNTVKLYTGEPNKSYTLNVNDNAANATTATVKTDSEGYLVITVEDEDYTYDGAYTFTLGSFEINLYDGIIKHIKKVENGEAYVGEKATATIITSDEVTMAQLKDEGGTSTATTYVDNGNGTRTWTVSLKGAEGVHEFTVRAKVNGKWIDEGKTATLTYTKKPEPPIGEVVSVDYTPSTSAKNTFKVIVTGNPDYIQFTYPDGGTDTFTKDRAEIEGDVWTVKATLPAGDYSARARYNGKWCEKTAFSVVLLEKDVPDANVYSIEIEGQDGNILKSGKHEVTVVTGKAVTKLMLKNTVTGSTNTYTADNAKIEEVEGKLVWKFTKNFLTGTDTTYNVKIRTETSTSFADSGKTIDVVVTY